MKVLIVDAVSRECDRILREAGYEVERREDVAEPDLPVAVAGCEGLVVRSRIRVTREAIEAGRRLRVIGRAGAGVDNIDVVAARQRGIEVLSAPGSNTRSVAEHVFALLLAVLRHVCEARAALAAGRWDRDRFLGRELAGRTMGIVGLGRIGRTVARVARGFGMAVIGNSPSAMRESRRREELAREGIELVEFPDLLERADVVTLHVPLNDVTRGLIGRRELARMKPDAVLINTSRGAVIDEPALVEALEENRIAGAGLDVYAQEPPPSDHPLRRLPNVVATPHVAASTREAQERAGRQIAEAIVRFFRRGGA